jgi:hypothetical protein
MRSWSLYRNPCTSAPSTFPTRRPFPLRRLRVGFKGPPLEAHSARAPSAALDGAKAQFVFALRSGEATVGECLLSARGVWGAYVAEVAREPATRFS